MEKSSRFAVPWRTKEDLTRQAGLYRLLAATMRDTTNAARMAELARNYASMAETVQD